MTNDIQLLRRLPHPLGLLIITQFAFNVGFYLVVPFLASYLQDDLGLGTALIGIILGLRTFSQQGLFFVGGALSDWLGIKPVLLVGIAIRVAGFTTLALTRQLPVVVLGVVLIGLAAALFSPASESAILGIAGTVERQDGPPRTQVLGLQQVASQAGSAVGPVLGGVVLFIPFRVTCLVAAGRFAVIGVVHAIWLPKGIRVGVRTRMTQSIAVVLRNRRFLGFAALNMVQLVAANQMYLALPVEIHRSQDESTTITWYFLLASILVITTQSRITLALHRFSTTRVLQIAHAGTALAFVPVAAVAWFPSPGGVWGVIPKVLLVVLVHVASMAIHPRARDSVGHLARENQLGAHMGVMASMGGLGVLLAGWPVGALLGWAETPGPLAVVPWLFLAALGAVAMLISAPVMRWVESDEPARWPIFNAGLRRFGG